MSLLAPMATLLLVGTLVVSVMMVLRVGMDSTMFTMVVLMVCPMFPMVCPMFTMVNPLFSMVRPVVAGVMVVGVGEVVVGAPPQVAGQEVGPGPGEQGQEGGP